MGAKNFTEKKKMFCDTYLANGYNVLQAYIEVYGPISNPHPSYPYRLIKEPEVQEYIQQKRQEIYDSLAIDAQRVMTEIADIAFQQKDDKNQSIKLKALELLSKNLNLQSQKVETKDTIEISFVED